MERPSWGLAEGDEIVPGRTVVRHLGTGARYEVFLVWDDHLFSLVVAKLLRRDRVEEERAMRGLRREARALRRLAHPVLLRGFDAQLEGPRPHVLVEHLEGPTLEELLQEAGALGLQQLLPLALSMASVLHYLGEEEMAHLDVKPANIVMGVPPRLIDLSLARSIESAERIRSPMGTVEYRAPEQWAPGEAGVVGPASDVYGLGATLYRAVSARLPYPSAAEIADAGGDERPRLEGDPEPLPPKVPPVLAELIMRSLSRDPAERPSPAELAGELEPLVDALPRKLVLGRRGRVI